MESVEAEGDSIDTAINAALKVLGTTRDRVEIDILTNASRGIFGIGSRKARVRATVRAPINADSVEPLARVAPTTPSKLSKTAESTPFDRAHDMLREPQGERKSSIDSGRVSAHAEALEATGRVLQQPARLPVAPAPVRDVSPAPIDDGVGERAAKILEEIVRHIGVEARVAVRREDDHFLLELSGDSSGVLIGRRGQMLDALEYLINRIVGRDEGTSRLLVDSENYRARRRTSLEEMARRMGEQAKRKGKPVTLNPMSPQDRRIVHLLLQEDTSLTTKSSGKGYLRRLIIIPEGASKVARDRR